MLNRFHLSEAFHNIKSLAQKAVNDVLDFDQFDCSKVTQSALKYVDAGYL